MTAACLLLVEPVAAVSAEVVTRLHAGPYEVVCAADGPEALRRFRERRFEVVLSAVALPSFSGFELCRSLRALPSGDDTALVLLGDYGDSDELLRALGCGADGLLARSVGPEQLTSRLTALVTARRRRMLRGLLDESRGDAGRSESDRVVDFLLWTLEEWARERHDATAREGVAAAASERDAAVRRVLADFEGNQRLIMSRLSAGVCHEISNPVSVVVMNHAALKHALSSLREKTNGDGRRAQGGELELDALEEMIDENIESLARVRRTLLELNGFASLSRNDEQQVQVNDVLASVYRLAHPTLDQRARVELDLRPLPRIKGHSEELIDAFWGLLLQTTARLPPDAPAKHRVHVSTREVARQVLVTIEDDGAPIPDEERRDYFDAYAPHWQREPGGSGLSLAVAREIIRRHGGTVELSSDARPGTRIEVSFPVSTQMNDEIPMPMPREVAPAPGRRPRVLLIDDEPNLLKAYRRVLGDYDVGCAEGGIAALALLRTDSNFDAIVMDLMMPDFDGKQIYDTLADTAPHLLSRIAFCTGGIFSARMKSFVASVGNPLLIKPVSADRLRETLRQLLAG